MSNENPTLYKAQIMFKQIEEKSFESSHWLLIGLKSMYNVNKDISLKDVIEFIELSCPIAKETSNNRIEYA